MKLYDISQEVFTCVVYPGDERPVMKDTRRMARGELYNLTDISMCAHNGTHVDSPFHFIEDGKTIDQIPLEKTVGMCYVAEYEGFLSAEDALEILKKASCVSEEASKRILLKGNATVTSESAEVFAVHGIYLIGVESQSVGEAAGPMPVHKILLKKEVVLLEGVRLGEVSEGAYFLSSAPINLGGSDGAPCRAILIELDA